jgi:putative spermidine/putrescine transport system permease protein
MIIRRKRGPYRLLGGAWTLPAVLFLAAFLVAPLVNNSIHAGHAQWGEYQRLLTDPYYLGILGETLWVSAATTALCVLVGYPVAYFMVRFAGRWQGMIVLLLVAPLLTSTVMRTFGWRALLARRGLVNSWLLDWGWISHPSDILNQPIAVYIGLVHVMAPFMVLSIATVLQGLDVRLEEGARVLGASRLRSFLEVTLPLSLDGVTTGSILVFMITNGSFITMLLLGGGKVVTLQLLIYQQFNLTQDVGFAASMGNVLLLLAIVCLTLQLRLVRRRGVV